MARGVQGQGRDDKVEMKMRGHGKALGRNDGEAGEKQGRSRRKKGLGPIMPDIPLSS
jgi:hypothetical protein